MKKKYGMTLLEILVAAFILAIAFIPILKVVTAGSVSTAKTGFYAKAARLAQQLIEECKHVPFRIYQKTYSELSNDDEEDVNPQYFSQTAQTIETFFDEERKKDALKDYGYSAKLRVKRNMLEQINEIWFEVEIFWNEKGDKNQDNGTKRHVRYANAYYNSEAM